MIECVGRRPSSCPPRLGERALRIDAPAGVLDDQRLEALAPRIERAPRDAEVGREAGEERAFEAALPEIAAEAGLRLAVRLDERRVAVDLTPVALAENELGVPDVQ